jgi:undecaprenyl-diphosphatase
MTGAFVHDAYKNRHLIEFAQSGSCIAFLSALLVVKPFLAAVSRIGFAPFSHYRVALGLTLASLSGTPRG